MSASLISRMHGWLVTAAVLVGAAAPVSGQSGKSAPLVQEAEKVFAQDRPLDAEPLFRKALESATGRDRDLCYDRLLTIYAQIGRHDKAIQTILQYQSWLKRVPDLSRHDELNLELGRLQFALGHAEAAAAP